MGLVTGAILASSAIGAISARNASKRSASAINNSTDQSVQVQREALAQQKELSQPWIAAGLNAQGNMDNPNENFQKSFDYDWRRSEGQRGVENLFSAKGGGGNAMRALNDYNQMSAGQEYGNWWNRQDRIAGRGQAAAAGQAANQGQAAANIGNTYANQGNMLSQNAWNRGSGINNALQSGIGNYMYAKHREWV